MELLLAHAPFCKKRYLGVSGAMRACDKSPEQNLQDFIENSRKKPMPMTIDQAPGFLPLSLTVHLNAGCGDGIGGDGTTLAGILLVPARYNSPTDEQGSAHMQVLGGCHCSKAQQGTGLANPCCQSSLWCDANTDQPKRPAKFCLGQGRISVNGNRNEQRLTFDLNSTRQWALSENWVFGDRKPNRTTLR